MEMKEFEIMAPVRFPKSYCNTFIDDYHPLDYR